MKIQITVNIPDGDYCENCQFDVLDGYENSICTLFGKELQTSCDYYRSLHGECDNRICCECPNIEHNGNAKCTACRDTPSNEKQCSEVSNVLKKEIQKLNEGLFWMGDSAEKRVSVREIIKLRNILEKAYYSISEKTKGKEK